MADPRDGDDLHRDDEEAMYNIIAEGEQYQDDGTQYLLNYDEMTLHENPPEQQNVEQEGNTGEPSGSTSTTGKSRPVRGPRRPLEGRHVISEFDEATGQPLGPNASKYVGHCGVLVRDRIPISAREWKEKRSNPEISFVSDRDKTLVWQDIEQHFTFDTNDNELKARIREWTMKKMATLFQAWKKTLYHKFIKKNETPDFNTKAYVKLRPYWNEFVQYKTSEEGEARVRINKQNAAQKKYHHHLGSGGYRTAIPKWDRMEREMVARG